MNYVANQDADRLANPDPPYKATEACAVCRNSKTGTGGRYTMEAATFLERLIGELQ